jgi:hypothetical protein
VLRPEHEIAASLRSSQRRLDCGNPRCGFARLPLLRAQLDIKRGPDVCFLRWGTLMSERRAIFKKVLALSMLTAVACACPKSPESTGVMLLDRMRQLAQESALTIELIQDTLEVAFVRDAEASHDMVTFFVGTPRPGSQFEGLIKLVDCRVPTPQNTVLSEPFVVVELQEATGEQPTDAHRRTTPLLSSNVVARFGQPDSFEPELPENPGSSGSYIYKVGSRSLWVSLSRQVPEQVMRLSIHALEDVR